MDENMSVDATAVLDEILRMNASLVRELAVARVALRQAQAAANQTGD